MIKADALSRDTLLAFTLPWLAPLLATALALLLSPLLPVANLTLIYLAAVLLTAVTTRTKPALACAILSFVAYNFFLTEPRFSLQMFHQEDVLTGILLVMAAVVTGQLTARLREQVEALRASEMWNAQQVACSRAFSSCVDSAAVIETLATQLEDALGWHARLTDHDELVPPADLGPADAKWVDDEAGVTVMFGGPDGQLAGAIRLSATERLGAWHRERLDVLVTLGRLAWARVQLTEALRKQVLDKEREQLRSALLSSVSHDLRTPLATMIGSVSSLIDLSPSLSEADREELLANTLNEARRLDRYIQKLLDMTRLGHGELTLDRDWIGADDLVSVVLKRSEPLPGQMKVEAELPPGLPLLHVHPALIEQALFNVLENAIRFSPPRGIIRLRASAEPGWLHIDVQDSGPGIAPEKVEQIFDMFHTFSHGDQYAAGTGLGLAICRSIMAAHRGKVSVLESQPGKGSTIRLSLPVADEPEQGSTD